MKKKNLNLDFFVHFDMFWRFVLMKICHKNVKVVILKKNHITCSINEYRFTLLRIWKVLMGFYMEIRGINSNIDCLTINRDIFCFILKEQVFTISSWWKGNTGFNYLNQERSYLPLQENINKENRHN